MSTYVMFLLCIVGHSYALLMQPLQSSQYTNEELHEMIKQLNSTVANQETQIRRLLSSQQITKNSAIGFYAQLSKDLRNLGDNRAIEFDRVITNDGNAYDPMHGHFTAPVNGMYLLSASVLSVSGHKLYCSLVKNGIIIGYLYGGAGDYLAYTHTSVLNLQAGDMVWVRHFAGYSDDQIHANYSNFSGFLIKQM